MKVPHKADQEHARLDAERATFADGQIANERVTVRSAPREKKAKTVPVLAIGLGLWCNE